MTVMGTHLVARGGTLRQGTLRSREVTLHSKVTRLHLELTHLHLGHTLLHLGRTLLHREQVAVTVRRGSSPTSCTVLPVLMVGATGTPRSMDTLLSKVVTLLSSMATLHSSMATPLPATLAHPVTVVAMEEAWAACCLEAQQLLPPRTEHTSFLTEATVEVDT